MSTFYYMATCPLILIAKFVFFFNIANMKNKLNDCIHTVDLKKNKIPNRFVPYLVAAEDHRSSYHYGIDPIGMARAFYVLLTQNKLQGASTIEQQFVRVVTNDYEQSLLRKFREQLLAIALTNKKVKKDIAKAYLAIAYYGYNLNGTVGISKLFRNKLNQLSENEIISIVARLKYPEPINTVNRWQNKHSSRIEYIKCRYAKAANKVIQH